VAALACSGKSVRKDEDGDNAGEGGTQANGGSNGGAIARGGVSGTSTGGSESGGGVSGTSSGGVSGTASGGSSGARGGSSGSASGGMATGGTGTGGVSGTGTCPTCTPTMCTTTVVPTALINDFENLYFDLVDPTFGIFGILDESGMQKPEWWLHYFSGSYAYPTIPQACSGEPTPMYPIARNEMEGVARVSGTVGGPSGFGIWFGPCIIDMSNWSGVRFTIGGRTGTGALVMSVGTSSDTDPDACQIGRGRCSTDLCVSPSLRLPIPDAPGIIALQWSAFMGGTPAATVDPSEVVELRWDFEWASGMTPYAVDVTLDNVMLFE
jgi:hypothetical protein